MIVAVAEEADLQRLDQILHVLRAGEQAGDRHQRACTGRDAARVVHPRQQLRRHRQGGRPVEQAHAKLTGQDDRGDGDRNQRPTRQGVVGGGQHQRPGEGECKQGQQTEVDRQRRPIEAAPHALGQVWVNAEMTFELRPATVDQIKAHVLRFGRCAFDRRAGLAQRDGRRGHLEFGEPMMARERLHHMAVTVARGEIHRCIDAGGILPQPLFDHAAVFDEFAPVDGGQRAQAADAVADADLVGRLLLRLGLHQVLDALARLGQALLDPAQRQRQRRALPLQPARHFGHERAGHRRLRTRHVGDDQHHALGIAFGGRGHGVGPARRLAAVAPVGHHPRGDAAQVLDQRQPQHDRDRPQLAQLERRHALVRADEAAQAAGVDAAVAVRDDFQRDVVHARQACRRPAFQSRQFAAVTPGQMPARQPDLFLDQVEIVQQPFAGRRHPPLAPTGLGQAIAGVRKHRLVVGQPGQQQVGAGTCGDPVLAREGLAVALHLLGAEQFRAQRGLLLRSRERRRATAAEGAQTPQLEQIENAADIQLHFPWGSMAGRRRGELPWPPASARTLRSCV